MNREILFKAKRIDNGEWVKGYYVKFQTCTSKPEYVHRIVPTYANGLYMIKINPDTLCQYTGLTENGRRIWENDIVSLLDTTSTENGYSEVYCIGKVSWDRTTASFQVSNRTMAESYEVLDEGCTVIGNIFDNPDLLEV